MQIKPIKSYLVAVFLYTSVYCKHWIDKPNNRTLINYYIKIKLKLITLNSCISFI